MSATYAVRVSGGVVCLDTSSEGARDVPDFMARVQKTAALAEAAPKLVESLRLAVMRLARVDGGDSIVVSAACDALLKATGEPFDFELAIAAEDRELTR